MTPKYIYKDNGVLVVFFKILGFILVILFLFSEFFYIGLLIILIFFFLFRNKYFRFIVFEDCIEVSNLITKRRFSSKDFLLASINDGNIEGPKSILLKTKDGSNVCCIPKNKTDALNIIKILEGFGIAFTKNQLYIQLMEWSKKPDQSNGAW